MQRSELLEKSFALKPKTHNFLINGLILPQGEHQNPLVKLLQPYYAHRENFIAATPPFTGKLDAVMAILNGLATERKVLVSDEALACPWWTHPDALESLDAYEHVVFYNTRCTRLATTAHVSIFIDTTRLADFYQGVIQPFSGPGSNWLRNMVSSIGAAAFAGELSADGPQLFTVVCSPEEQQKVEFIFLANDGLRKATVELLPDLEQTAVLSQKLAPSGNEQYDLLAAMPKTLKCKQFVFGELGSVDEFEYVLNRVANVKVLFSCDDRARLGDIASLMLRRGIAVPAHIQELASSSG
ncbi:hypothetical protein PAPHI01_0874 [Pancytospora philotis]|nr:hypothetical protein PAPHI01_0874 [Pancytospora philotis]